MDGQGNLSFAGLGAGKPGGIAMADPSMADPSPPTKKKSRRGGDPANQKRRCVSTACIACRRRKSKCDGALPSCAACASVYGTECVYDPNSDHRRKGVYREKIDSMKAQNSTLQILIEAILNADEEDVPAIVKKIRTCDSLDAVAESIMKQEMADAEDESDYPYQVDDEYTTEPADEGERELARKMGELRIENGLVRFIGGTSHLIYQGDPADVPELPEPESSPSIEDPITSWSEVTKDTELIVHLINMYFTWHYPYFTTLSKSLFYRDFLRGKRAHPAQNSTHCSSLLVNAMLALGCHFTNVPGAFANPDDSRTKGDHFSAEAKRLIIENDEYEKPRLTTVQALALMSVREAGCAREAKGWVYSGMSFRMAQDMGLNLDTGGISKGSLNDQEVDARRITFWGCFLFDKCWSNYLGRLPQLPRASSNVPKYDVFPDEDAELWSPYTDGGFDQSAKQPSRTRAIGLQMSKLCEISSDLLLFFYHPNHLGRSSGKAIELKKLSELHRRLEDWKKELPKEFEPKEGQLPNVILMHMFYHLQYIHLFRPFLRYTPASSPLPSHVSPRRICTANAGAISKLMRLYKKIYNLRQICNIAVYMAHSAVTIHMLNLPERTAKRDIIHGVKQLEEIAEDWLCSRRTLSILSVLARKWNVEMPEEAMAVLQRTDEKFGTFSTLDVPSPNRSAPLVTPSPAAASNSPATSQKEMQFPPISHIGQPTPPQIPAEAPPLNMPTDMLSTFGVPAAAPPQGMPAQMTGQVTNDGSLSIDDVFSWAMPQAVTQPIPNYASRQFAPAANRNTPVTSTSESSRTGTRQVSPTSLYAIDGGDWYLKDGVNWQQAFGSWDMGGAVGAATTASPDYKTNAARADYTPSPAGTTPADMFMFRGNFDESLDSFGSIGPLDHLPGLD